MGEESPLSPLQNADIALLIIGELDSYTILSIRLVSRQINALVLAHQISLSKTRFSHAFSGRIAWHPPGPEIDSLPDNFHLKTLTRLTKAYELARRANKDQECHAEIRESDGSGQVSCFWPTPAYFDFLARCTRCIMILWILNDIRQHYDSSEFPPSYISSLGSPPPSRTWRFMRPSFTSRTTDTASASSPPIEINALATSQYVATLQSRNSSDGQSYLSISSAQQTYLRSLPQSHRIDLIWVLDYLRIGIPRPQPLKRMRADLIIFALHQGPKFLGSWLSSDLNEQKWARELARQVVHMQQMRACGNNAVSLPTETETLLPLLPGEDREALAEASLQAKAELTRGDWRHA